MGESESIRVLVVEISPILRLGLTSLLNREPDMKVVGHFDTGGKAVEALSQLRPEVVLVGTSLRDMSGFQACIDILEAAPVARVVLLTQQVSSEELVAVVFSGAAGYLPIGGPEVDLIRTVRANGRGEMWFIPEVAELTLRSSRSNRRVVDVSSLSDREKQVLFLAAGGLSNAEIGERLGLSPHTVRNHTRIVLSKLKISGRAELGGFALAAGMWDVFDDTAP